MSERRHPKPCTSRNCLNGWYRHMGSDYPCGTCESYWKFQKELREAKKERENEAYAHLF